MSAAVALRRLVSRLRARPDSEHEMSLNRLGFALVILACQAILSPPDPEAAWFAVLLWGGLSLGVFLHLMLRPGISAPRRAVALLLDIGFLSWYLHIGGEAHALFIAIYLWVVFGNGFRFGLAWLRAAMAATLAGFGAVVLTTPFWREQPHLSIGLLVGFVVLPLYAGVLIRKLSDARRAAEAASQAKSMFLANVSHELRTPLNAIIGMGALLRDTRLDADQRDMMRTIGTAARSLLELIDDILDLSRIEAGRMPVRIEAFDLPELMAEVRSLVAAQARLRGIRVGLHIAAGTPARIAADRRHLHEILVNLAGNAVKFTETGGVSIAVRGEPAGLGRARLCFEVSDTGMGIAPDAQQRIFESFAQADPTIIARFGGTGLGLAICRRLAALMGGSIGLDSAPGAGSTFRVELEAGALDTPLEPPRLPGATVLLLAGDEAAAGLLPALGALGLSAKRAASFAEAAREAEEQGWPLLADARLVPGAGTPGGPGLAPPSWPEIPLLLLGAVPPGALPRGPDRWAASVLPRDPSAAQLALALRAACLARGEPAETAPGAAEAAAETPSRRLRVLVADDNAVNRKVAARILERAGHAVALVPDGEAALEALSAAAEKGPDFDLVLMDVNMPVLDGIEATKLLRFERLGHPSRIPVLGLTADATPETKARCAEAGMDGCVTKPVEPAQLLQAITGVLPKPVPRPAAEVEELVRHPRFRPAPPALDMGTIGQLETLGGRGFVAEVAADFLREGAEALRLVGDAAAAGDTAALRTNAHALGSIAANIGARALQAACSATQRLDQRTLVARAGSEAEAIAAEFERVREALRELRGAA